jgi:chromosome segregation ATPase
MRRFLFAVGVFGLLTSPLRAQDNKDVKSAVDDIKMNITALKTQIAKKREALEQAEATAIATSDELRKIRQAASGQIQAVKAGMEIALGAVQATEKTRDTALAEFKEFVRATDKAIQPALLKSARARNELDALNDELGKAERDLRKTIAQLDSLLKK